MNVSRFAAVYERQIRDAQEKLALLESLPSVDDYPDGTAVRVIVNTKYGVTRRLTYVLLKIVRSESVNPNARHDPDAKWYFTGQLNVAAKGGIDARHWMTWDQVVAWLLNDVAFISWDVLTVASDTVDIVLIDDYPKGQYRLTRGDDGRYR